MILLIAFMSLVNAQEIDDRSCFERSYDIFYANYNRTPDDNEVSQIEENCTPALEDEEENEQD